MLLSRCRAKREQPVRLSPGNGYSRVRIPDLTVLLCSKSLDSGTILAREHTKCLHYKTGYEPEECEPLLEAIMLHLYHETLLLLDGFVPHTQRVNGRIVNR